MNQFEGYSYAGVEPKQAVPSAIMKFVNKRKYRPEVLIARKDEIVQFKPVARLHGLSLMVGTPQPFSFWLGYVVNRKPVVFNGIRTPVEET